MIPSSTTLNTELAVVGDLSEGAKLRDCRRMTLSELGAKFDSNMTHDQWMQFGRLLHRIKGGFRYCLADWMSEGKKRWGGEAVKDGVADIGFDSDDVEMASQLTLFPASKRVAALTAGHHEQLGFLIDHDQLKVEDVDKWLLLAREEGLSEGELYNSIIAGHVVKRPESERKNHSNRDGFLSIHGINTRFSRWLKNAEENGEPVEKMPVAEKRRILIEIEPIAALHSKLKAEVEA